MEHVGNWLREVSITTRPGLDNMFVPCSQVKDHNANSSKNGQLVGSKAQAVKNILHSLPSKVRQLIVDYTTEVGYESSPWQDDCLGSKKWLPGFAFLISTKPFLFLVVFNSNQVVCPVWNQTGVSVLLSMNIQNLCLFVNSIYASGFAANLVGARTTCGRHVARSLQRAWIFLSL